MSHGRAIQVALLSGAVLFAAAFVLGALRSVLIAPLSGELAAVALEAPVMLAISWSACSWVLEQFEARPAFLERLVMGGVALLLVVVAEAAVAVLARDLPLFEFLHDQSRSAVLLGLMAQLAFALFPMLPRRNGR